MPRRLIPALLGVLLLVLTAAAAVSGYAMERADDERERQYAAAQLADGLDLLRRDLGGRIRDVAGLFETAPAVTPEQFDHFTRRILGDSSALSFSWNVLIDHDERAAYERAHGGSLMELAPDGSFVPAKRRSQYVVTEMAVAREGGRRSVVGLVQSSAPDRGGAIDMAMLDGEPRITPMIKLAGDGLPGFIVYTPAYRDAGAGGERGTDVIGFAGAAYRVQDLASRLAPSLPRGFAVQISTGGQEVFATGPLEGPADRAVVEIGGRPFTVQVARTTAGQGINEGTVALLVGLLFTVAVMLLARQMVMSADRASEQRDRAVRRERWQEQAMRRLLGHLPDLAVLHFDRDLQITRATGGLLDRITVGEVAIEGRLVHDVLPDSAGAEIVRCIEEALAGREATIDAPLEMHGALHCWIQALPVEGDTPGGILVISNVTPLVDATKAQTRAEERFRKAFDDGPVGMALIGRDGHLLEVNAAFCELTGRRQDRLAGVAAAELSHPDDVHIAERPYERLLAGERAVHFEQRYLKADGTPVWVGVHVSMLTDESGSDGGLFLAQVLDIGERMRFEQELRRLADQDPLTGIANRRAFERAIDAHAEAAVPHGGSGVVMMIDLDHFKAVNDQLGHEAGDALLVGIAQDLSAALRPGDLIARLGGDEFAVLLPRVSPEAAPSVAAKLVERVRRRGAEIDLAGAPAPTATIGIAAFSPGVATGAQALRAADRAMYAAKAIHRDGYGVYDPQLHGPVAKAADRGATVA